MDKIAEHIKEYEQIEKEHLKQRAILKKQNAKFAMCMVSLFIALVLFGSTLSPIYNAWTQRISLESELVRAQSKMQIRLLEAKAEQEAARALAEAEVVRAEGVARANKIIGDSVQNNEGYLRYLWIQGLQHSQTQVVYVPTDANLPILGATRSINDSKSK